MNTKEKIFDVSLDLFSKKGYDSVSLREIAEEVGIQKSSIYSHYSSKEAIFVGCSAIVSDFGCSILFAKAPIIADTMKLNTWFVF